MVIDGSKIRKEDFDVATLEGDDRINLPVRFVKQAELDKDESERIVRVLLVVFPGRYRLLTEASEEVDRIRIAMEEVAVPGSVLDETDSSTRPAIRGRLIPCTVTRPKPSWRMILPKVAIQLAPGERSHVFLIIVRGFVELWFPDTLRDAMKRPISEVL